MSKKFRWNRLWTLYGLTFGLYCYLIGGLFYRQIFQYQSYISLATRQSYRRILLPAPRGNIYDRNGKLLAGTRPRFSLVIHLAELGEDFRREYRKLSREAQLNGRHEKHLAASARLSVVERYLEAVNRFLGIDQRVDGKQLERHFLQQPLLPYVLIEDLSTEAFARLTEELPVSGPLQLRTSTARFYPQNSLAAHVIGYASPTTFLPQDDVIGDGLKTFNERGTLGRAGIEQYCDSELRGYSGGEIWVVDPTGKKTHRVYSQDVTPGENIVLTLDASLQQVVEEALRNEVGCVVVSQVQTGEILALASSPSYNLNDLTPFIPQPVYERINREGGWFNQATQGLYPPGSSFKIVTYYSLLRRGLIDNKTTTLCNGGTSVGNRFIRCHNHFERGELVLERAFAKSCNSFCVRHVFDLALEDFLGDMRALGFGQKTGIEIPGESSHSLVPSPQWKKAHGYSRWTDGDTANLSIGQGFLLVTPLQMNAMTVAIATRRLLPRLTILGGQKNKKRCDQISEEPLPISDEAYRTLIRSMCACVEYGSGKRCKIEGFSIAGKTGTAQIREKEGKSHLAWFTAFAPADDPLIAVTVMIREKAGGRSYGGGMDAVPIARRIFRAYFSKNL